MSRRLSLLACSSLLFVSAAVESYAATAEKRSDSRKTRIVRQTVPPPSVPYGIAEGRESAKSCTYRGGPKSHIWECQ
jgi:hypothetical protein